jgi:hypothetical protein
MFRKITLAGLTALSFALPLGLTSTAQAEPAPNHYYHRVYEVQYRRHHEWHCYGTYREQCEADRAAHHLRHDGYEVRIEIR